MRVAALLIVASMALGLAGCSSTIHDEARLGDLDTLSIDTKQRLVLVRKRADGTRIVCAEPSPDAIVAISAAFAAGGSGTRATGESIKAAIGGGSSESVASIAMRTASVQTLRDGYYRLCEGVMNGVIQPYQYLNVIKGIDTFVASVMAIDSISGMVHPPAIAISGGSATARANGTEGSSATAGGASGTTLFVENLVVEEGNAKAREIEAKAIQDIVTMYLRSKRCAVMQDAKLVVDCDTVDDVALAIK